MCCLRQVSGMAWAGTFKVFLCAASIFLIHVGQEGQLWWWRLDWKSQTATDYWVSILSRTPMIFNDCLNFEQFDTGVSSRHCNNVPEWGRRLILPVSLWNCLVLVSTTADSQPLNLQVTLIDMFWMLVFVQPYVGQDGSQPELNRKDAFKRLLHSKTHDFNEGKNHNLSKLLLEARRTNMFWQITPIPENWLYQETYKMLCLCAVGALSEDILVSVLSCRLLIK